jgi:hypothetical protein
MVLTSTDFELTKGTGFRTAYHAGRLAVQQLYGYMTRNALVYGVLTTVNGFVFMVRGDLGKVRITRLLPCDAINPHQPTILQWLYMFSAYSVASPLVPETDGQGNILALEFSSSKHPGMDNTARIPPPAPPPTQYTRGGRSFRPHGQQYALVANPDPPKVLFETWKPENQLGPKTFLVQLVPGDKVVAKVWDGWKHKSTDRDIEAEMLLKLQPLWGGTVPTLIGTGEVDFLWTVLIEHIQVIPQYFGLMKLGTSGLRREHQPYRRQKYYRGIPCDSRVGGCAWRRSSTEYIG